MLLCRLTLEPCAEGDFDFGLGEEADFLVAEVADVVEVRGDRDQQADAVVENRRTECDRGVCGVGEVKRERRQQIDLIVPEGLHAGDIVGIFRDGGASVGAEDRDRDGLADIRVEGLACAVIVRGGVFGRLLIDAAAKEFGLTDVIEGGCGVCWGCRKNA